MNDNVALAVSMAKVRALTSNDCFIFLIKTTVWFVVFTVKRVLR